MRRTKQLYSMFEPEIAQILKETEPNISLYVHDLVCSDLIKRGKLTTKRLLELQVDAEPDNPAPQVQVV